MPIDRRRSFFQIKLYSSSGDWPITGTRPYSSFPNRPNRVHAALQPKFVIVGNEVGYASIDDVAAGVQLAKHLTGPELRALAYTGFLPERFRWLAPHRPDFLRGHAQPRFRRLRR